MNFQTYLLFKSTGLWTAEPESKLGLAITALKLLEWLAPVCKI